MREGLIFLVGKKTGHVLQGKRGSTPTAAEGVREMMGVIGGSQRMSRGGGTRCLVTAPFVTSPPLPRPPPPVLRPVQRGQGRGAHGGGQPAPPRGDGGGGMVGVGVVEGEVLPLALAEPWRVLLPLALALQQKSRYQLQPTPL